MVELFANSGDPGQMPHSAASDLGLHCLPVISLGVSSLQKANSFLHKNRSCVISLEVSCRENFNEMVHSSR